jgi:hypothetical protein
MSTEKPGQSCCSGQRDIEVEVKVFQIFAKLVNQSHTALSPS